MADPNLEAILKAHHERMNEQHRQALEQTSALAELNLILIHQLGSARAKRQEERIEQLLAKLHGKTP